jgi:hypothetical protein
MYQELINSAIGLVSGLLIWVVKSLWDAVRDLQKSDRELTDKINNIEVLVAGDYVKREDFRLEMDRLFKKLDAIEQKIDGKVDKR